MAFKINISNNGKTYKLELENESLVGKKIGELFEGSELTPELEGYSLEITGTSDISGKPGSKGLEGPGHHRVILKRGFGMRDTRDGIRLRKTMRGEEISLKTVQINMKVLKPGKKKFEELFKQESDLEKKKE